MADAAEILDPTSEVLTAAAQGRLKSFFDRIDRMEEEKAEVAEALKEIYAEAKGEGFDTKIMKKIVALKKVSKAKRQEEEALIDLYMVSIGAA